MKKWFFYLNFENIWLFFCALAISGTTVYYLYALNILGTSIAIIIALSISYFFRIKKDILLNSEPINNEVGEPVSKKWKLNFSILYFILSFSSILLVGLILFNHRSEVALISPWSVTPSSFFIILFIASIFTLLSLRTKGHNFYKQILFSSYLMLIFSIASIIYRLGYGFDTHIHFASLQEIIRAGYILPKTPYYLGQYSLIIVLYRTLGISLNFLNTYLLAISAALVLPFLFTYLQIARKDDISSWTAKVLLILLGFTPFIVNTPQNFSFLFLLATIIFIYKDAKMSLIIFSALATCTIHPLAGIPAILITAHKFLQTRNSRSILIKLALHPIVSGGLFLATFILAIWSIAGFSRINLTDLNLALALPQFPNKAGLFLNLSYTFISNYPWLIIGLSILLIFLRRKIWFKRSQSEKVNTRLLMSSAILTLLVYLISSMIYFPALIAYEQDGYTKRLLSITLIISLPLFWELFYYLAKKAKDIAKGQKIIMTIAIPLLLLIAIYGSYPRFDQLYSSRGHSSSNSDVEAVLLAEKLAGSEKYIVLANQQVSAMALKEFGFHNRYLKKDGQEFYFYPIPTGAKLYQYFLDLSYKKADRETIIQAMDYAGVNRAYLIVNRYWWASPKIIAEAKMSADNWYKLGEENNYLFEYER